MTYEQFCEEDDVKEVYDDIGKYMVMAEDLIKEYDQNINTINEIRHSEFKDQIGDLYDFLTKFKDVGTPVSGYDFVYEKFYEMKEELEYNYFMEYILPDRWVPIESELVQEDSFVGGFLEGIGMVAAAAAFIPLVAVPAIISGDGDSVAETVYDMFRGSGDSFNEEEKWQEITLYREHIMDHCLILIELTEILVIYRETIDDVAFCIRRKIIPELEGVTALIKNMSYVEEIMTGREVSLSAKDLQRTQQNTHLMFIRNAMDFYRLITEMFEKPTITNLLYSTDSDIVEEDRAKMESRLTGITEDMNRLTDSKYFGENNG